MGNFTTCGRCLATEQWHAPGLGTPGMPYDRLAVSAKHGNDVTKGEVGRGAWMDGWMVGRVMEQRDARCGVAWSPLVPIWGNAG